MSLANSFDFDLNGLIDMHIHTGPDVRPRLLDDIEAVRAAKEAGMHGLLIKSHVTLTADRAFIAEKTVGGIHVFGGLALNKYIGGFNPDSVEIALKMGAKVIWMPTLSALNELKQSGETGGLTIFDENGKLRSEVIDIIDLIHHFDAILSTGHLSADESVALVKMALKRGLRKIVVSHPESPITRMPVDTQAEILRKGIYFERCYVNTTSAMNYAVTIQEIAAMIRKIGVTSTLLTTDFGLASLPPPVKGMQEYLARLTAEGFSRNEIGCMACDNPSYLLDI
ncbi:MAG: hypothetical protein JSV31_25965 [Desulfobacterales bacterium]|nr:MAG: hypothetical protein JSV31_25965 [Desulfobacterales bacterium]